MVISFGGGFLQQSPRLMIVLLDQGIDIEIDYSAVFDDHLAIDDRQPGSRWRTGYQRRDRVGGAAGMFDIVDAKGDQVGGLAGFEAADVVAGRHGYTGKQIRTTLTPFNNLPMLPDTTTGKLRRMYRFDKEFSNEVIVELRTNARFKPEDTPSLGATLAVGATRKLSEGPF